MLPLAEARRRRTPIDWSGYDPPKPSFLGVRVFEPYPLAELVPFIDWSPFFHTWELKGTYPRIFDNPTWGARAKELFDDAQGLLRRIVTRAGSPRGRRSASSPRSAGRRHPDLRRRDAVEGARDLPHPAPAERRSRPTSRTRRWPISWPPRRPASPTTWALFAVTAGIGIEPLLEEFERDHDDYNSIMTKALADRLAEALAEALHRSAREEWGYGKGEALGYDDLIRERYRGIRPAPGYPASPDHTEKRTLFDLLDAEKKIGIRLTESFAMHPASSVSGLYFSHPEARYFQVGRIGGGPGRGLRAAQAADRGGDGALARALARLRPRARPPPPAEATRPP